MMNSAHQSAIDWLDTHLDQLGDWSFQIWSLAEPAWREYESADWYVKTLRQHGFEVEEASGQMPTAFAASWSNGRGPHVACYAEYDAVPGNCQAAVTHRQPRDGLCEHAAGHTDPHSALGISSLGGLLATQAVMKLHDIRGTLRFTGEPAEKVRGSKPIHAARGYYDNLDGMISFHPCYMLPLCNTVRWDTHCGAAYSLIYRFTCDQPQSWIQHADAAPIPQAHSQVRAPGANDALFQMYSNSKSLRDSMLPHTGHWSISETVLTAGQATADNLPARLAEIQYIVRVPTIEMAEQVVEILDRNAAAAAAISHCRYEKFWVSKSRPGLANHAMANMVYESLAQIGPPVWDHDAVKIARQFQATLGVEQMDKPFLAECETLIRPQQAENILRRDLPPSQSNHTSDDYTEMCWHAPTARFYIARPMLKSPPGFIYPDWVMNALGGIRNTIDPMIATASKTVSLSLLKLLEDRQLRQSTKAEFVMRTGGGTGGDKWIAPLCDYPPPVHFRWPEYVWTKRGRDWWIPRQGY